MKLRRPEGLPDLEIPRRIAPESFESILSVRDLERAFESARAHWVPEEVGHHPNPGEILRWARGGLNEADATVLRVHALRCGECMEVWSALTPGAEEERAGGASRTGDAPSENSGRGETSLPRETKPSAAFQVGAPVPRLRHREAEGTHIAMGALRITRLASAELYRQLLGIAGRDTRETDISRVCHARWIDFARAMALLPESLEAFMVLGATGPVPMTNEIVNAVVVEGRGTDAESASRGAREALVALERLARACLDYAEVEAVQDDCTLDALESWIYTPSHVMEIRRRWEFIRAGVLARGHIGVAMLGDRSETVAKAPSKAYDLRHLYPWVPSDDSWQRLAGALLAEQSHSALVVHFRGYRGAPEAVREQARAALLAVERAEGVGVHPRADGSAMFFGQLQVLSREALARVSELQGDTVAARVFLTGNAKPSAALEAIAAASLDDASIDSSRPAIDWMFRGGTSVRQVEAREVGASLDSPSLDVLFGPREVAAVLRTPMPTMIELPGLPLSHSRTAPAKSPAPSGCPLGVNEHRGLRQPIAIEESVRFRHVYIVGQTGTGKSTTLLPMILHDIAAARGAVVLIDPHGSLIQDVLERYPAHREDALTVLDPSDTEFPVPFNPLVIPPGTKEYQSARDLIVDDIFSYIEAAYDLGANGGPMFETHFRGMLTLLMGPERPPDYVPSLLHLRLLYQSSPLRKRLLGRFKADPLQGTLIRELEGSSGDHSLGNMSQYVTSKFQRFVSESALRNMTCQKGAVDFAEVIQAKKVVLVNLAKGRFGEKAAGLLASQIVSRLQMALMARGAETGPPIYLYADEFQIFAGLKFAELLAEGRKFRFAATMAHQFADQLPKALLGAVLGNVGTTLAFRVGPKDAELLGALFQPTFGPDDLSRLPNFRACARSVDRRLDLVPFSLEAARPADDGDPDHAERLRRKSRIEHGTPRARAENEIQQNYAVLSAEVASER